MASEDLRARVAKALRIRLSQVHAVGTVLAPTAAVDYIGMTEFDLADAVMALLDAEVDAVAERGAAAIAALGADVRATRAERDRFRAAWQSARQRAQAYGEGILRHIADRDAYKGWMDEQAERASRAEQELAAVRATLETLTAQSATALVKRDQAKQRARIAEAELEALRGGLREIGGDPTQVQNLYAQLSSRTRQWKELQAEQAVNDAAWGSVWLHGKWSWLTKNMTTPERELAADAVARWSAGLAVEDGQPDRGEPEGLRWWRESKEPSRG